MSTYLSTTILYTFVLYLRICTPIEYECEDSTSSGSPCDYACSSETISCETGDTFNCLSNKGCVIDCSSTSCNNLNIHQYALGITNIICDGAFSCNNINITSHSSGYVYLLCTSSNSCNNISIFCMHQIDSIANESKTRECVHVHTLCSTSDSCHNIQSYLLDIVSVSNPSFSNQHAFIRLFTSLGLFEFIVILFLTLICCVNMVCCGYCICCRNLSVVDELDDENNGNMSIKHYHHQHHQEHIETLKDAHVQQTRTDDAGTNDGDGYYYNDLDHHQQSEYAYHAQQQQEEDEQDEDEQYYQHVEQYANHNSNNNERNEQSDEAEEEEEVALDPEYHSENDLENAPILDLRELDESISSYHGLEDRADPDGAFWTEQPTSPKRQDNITDEKKKFDDEEEEEDQQDGDGASKKNGKCPDVLHREKSDSIPVPQITNTDPHLPIPSNIDSRNFEYMTAPKKGPSAFSIISPRNFRSPPTHGIDKNNPTPSPKILQRKLRNAELENNIIAGAGDEKQQYEIHAFDERAMQQLLMMNGSTKFKSKTSAKSKNRSKGKRQKTRKFKDKYRETITVSDGDNNGADNHDLVDVADTEAMPEIVRFGVNNNGNNQLSNIIDDDDGDMEEQEHVQRSEEDADDDESTEDDEEEEEEEVKVSVIKQKQNQRRFKNKTIAQLFASPKSKANSKNTPLSPSMSPKNLMNHIIKLSPRINNGGGVAGMHAEHDNQLLIPPDQDSM